MPASSSPSSSSSSSDSSAETETLTLARRSAFVVLLVQIPPLAGANEAAQERPVRGQNQTEKQNTSNRSPNSNHTHKQSNERAIEIHRADAGGRCNPKKTLEAGVPKRQNRKP
jgi:hypothetical protein